MRVSDINRLGNDLETDGSDLHSWIGIPLGTDGVNYNKLNVDTEGRQANKQYVWNPDTLAWEAGTASSGGGTAPVVQYSVRMDEVGTDLYVGEALPNSGTGLSVWRIKKVTDNGALWADGTASFTKIWDDRLSYSYS